MTAFDEGDDENLKRLKAHQSAEALADGSNRLRVQNMTREEFLALPRRASWDSKEEPFSAIVILPLDEVHDSGYRCMDFIGVRGDFPVCRLAGDSDMLHINGIGGQGRYLDQAGKGWEESMTPRQHAWNIDCLRTSGLLRLWDDRSTVTPDSALSSFSIFTNPKEKG